MAQAQAIQNRYITRKGGTADGEPIIKGTRVSVRTIVELRRQGIAPEEIPRHLPHITVAQAFDALSYFSDHPDEINDFIARNRFPEELVHPAVRDL